MALVTCPDCKTEISSDAKACPKCGRAKPGMPTSRKVLLVLLLATALFAVWAWNWVKHV